MILDKIWNGILYKKGFKNISITDIYSIEQITAVIEGSLVNQCSNMLN